MTTIVMSGFKAEIPRLDSKLLPASHASQAINVDTSGGTIDLMRVPAAVYELLTDMVIRTMYHYEYDGTAYWLVWDRDGVDVALSTVAQDTAGRVYFTGDGEPRMTTYADGISGSSGPYPALAFVLGVTAPDTKPTITPPIGGTTETRTYLYTFVTALGEESGPSPSETDSGDAAGTWALSNLDTAPLNTGSVTSTATGTNTATITIGSTFGLFVGEELVLAGTGVTGLDGKRPIVSLTSTTATFNLAGATGSGTGGTWTRVAKHNTTGMLKRIYRTVGTSTTYRMVDEIAAATTTYNDSITATVVAANRELSNIEPNTPPKDLRCLINLPNNCLAGVSDEYGLCISEIEKPHSWPISYRYASPSKIVSLVASGNGAILLTNQGVRYATIPTPGSASFNTIGSRPCVSKTGVVALDGGACIYPSLDLPHRANSGTTEPIFAGLMQREEWNTLTPSTIKAVLFDGYYMASYLNAESEVKMFRISLASQDCLERIDFSPDALHVSAIDGNLYLAKGKEVLIWGNSEAGFLVASWISKLHQLDRPTNFSHAKVDADYGATYYNSISFDIAYNASLMADPKNLDGAIGSAAVGTIAVGCSRLRRIRTDAVPNVAFTIYDKDMNVLFTTTVTSADPFTLPAGFEHQSYLFGLYSNVMMRSLVVSTSMREMKAATP